MCTVPALIDIREFREERSSIVSITTRPSRRSFNVHSLLISEKLPTHWASGFGIALHKNSLPREPSSAPTVMFVLCHMLPRTDRLLWETARASPVRINRWCRQVASFVRTARHHWPIGPNESLGFRTCPPNTQESCHMSRMLSADNAWFPSSWECRSRLAYCSACRRRSWASRFVLAAASN